MAAARKKAAQRRGAKTTRTRVPPVQIKRPGAMEPLEEQIGQDGTAHFASDVGDGSADAELIRVRKEQVDSPEFDEKAALLAFNEEMVTVVLSPPSHKDEDRIVEIAINDRKQMFLRDGQPVTVRRKFVEKLARLKRTSYANEEFQDPNDGVHKVRWPSTTGVRYPFSVVEDRHPRGAEWLRSVLAQP